MIRWAKLLPLRRLGFSFSCYRWVNLCNSCNQKAVFVIFEAIIYACQYSFTRIFYTNWMIVGNFLIWLKSLLSFYVLICLGRILIWNYYENKRSLISKNIQYYYIKTVIWFSCSKNTTKNFKGEFHLWKSTRNPLLQLWLQQRY